MRIEIRNSTGVILTLPVTGISELRKFKDPERLVYSSTGNFDKPCTVWNVKDVRIEWDDAHTSEEAILDQKEQFGVLIFDVE